MSTQKIQFISKHRGLRLVRRDADEIVTTSGKVSVREPMLVYEFQDGDLFIEPGRDELPDGPWDKATGNRTMQDALAWLRAHEDYGTRFHEMTPVAPDPGDLYLRLAEFAGAGDLDAIHDLFVEEKESWNRDDVLERIKQVGVQLEDRLIPAGEDPDG